MHDAHPMKQGSVTVLFSSRANILFFFFSRQSHSNLPQSVHHCAEPIKIFFLFFFALLLSSFFLGLFFSRGSVSRHSRTTIYFESVFADVDSIRRRKGRVTVESAPLLLHPDGVLMAS